MGSVYSEVIKCDSDAPQIIERTHTTGISASYVRVLLSRPGPWE